MIVCSGERFLNLVVARNHRGIVRSHVTRDVGKRWWLARQAFLPPTMPRNKGIVGKAWCGDRLFIAQGAEAVREVLAVLLHPSEPIVNEICIARLIAH